MQSGIFWSHHLYKVISKISLSNRLFKGSAFKNIEFATLNSGTMR